MTIDNQEIVTPEDHDLFRDIANEIRNNPGKYSEAGKWLDEYCSETGYWQRQENKLKELQAQEKRFPTLPIAQHVRQLEKDIEVRRTPALIIRFQEAMNNLIEKYKDQQFIPEADAKKIIIIAWLLTDPDAEKANLNITQLEEWSWEPIDDVTKLSRGYENFLWFQGGKAYGPWMNLIRIAWPKLAQSINETVSLSGQDEKKKLARSFLNNLLRASIKHFPIGGPFLYDVIFGTLNGRASQKMNHATKVIPTQKKLKRKQERNKDTVNSKKSSDSLALKVAKITLITAIITLISAILTSPLWRPLIGKWTGDSSDSKKMPMEKKLPRSLKEICKDIDSRPLLQREETAKRYIGIKVERERLELFDIHEYADEGTFSLTMIFPEELDESYLTGRKFFCTVERHRYPELNAAKRGLEFYLSGQIEEAGRSYIKVSNVSLNFD